MTYSVDCAFFIVACAKKNNQNILFTHWLSELKHVSAWLYISSVSQLTDSILGCCATNSGRELFFFFLNFTARPISWVGTNLFRQHNRIKWHLMHCSFFWTVQTNVTFSESNINRSNAHFKTHCSLMLSVTKHVDTYLSGGASVSRFIIG